MAEYIEREYAVDAVVDVYYNTPDINLSCEKFETEIFKIPAADVAPVRHGRWQYNTDFYVWRCSECGENPHKGTGVVVSEENLPAYCPHCGARMDGDGNG